MFDEELTIIRLTPPGRGAVAVLQLTGSEVIPCINRHWIGPRLEVEDRPIFGRIRLQGTEHVEEVVLHIISPTMLEIHCHGGEAIVTALEKTFSSPKEPGTERSAVPGRTAVLAKSLADASCSDNQLRALELLPQAKTERTAQILLDQYNGALERELTAIESLTDLSEKHRREARLAENAKLAKHLIEPFHVVLAGETNAGKSSLLNALLGFQRSIVDPTPGTTRDVVSGETAIDGFLVQFSDTAGFRTTVDDLEREGIKRSEQSLADADLVVWVVDSTVLPENHPKAPELPNLLVCVNKIDLLDDKIEERGHSPRLVGVSALTGEGIDRLLHEIIVRLVPNPPEPLEGVPLN